MFFEAGRALRLVVGLGSIVLVHEAAQAILGLDPLTHVRVARVEERGGRPIPALVDRAVGSPVVAEQALDELVHLAPDVGPRIREIRRLSAAQLERDRERIDEAGERDTRVEEREVRHPLGAAGLVVAEDQARLAPLAHSRAERYPASSPATRKERFSSRRSSRWARWMAASGCHSSNWRHRARSPNLFCRTETRDLAGRARLPSVHGTV